MQVDDVLRQARAKLRHVKRHHIHRPKGWRPRAMSTDESLRYAERFMNRADRLTRQYPIIALRQRLKDVLTLFAEERVHLIHSQAYENTTRPRLGSPLTTGKDERIGSVMIIWSPTWRDQEIALRHSLPAAFARRCLDDFLMITLLHEGFHLVEQVLPGPMVRLNQRERIDYEVACWSYTCRDVIQPMVAHGRAPFLPCGNGDTLLRHWNAFFELVECDAGSPIWRRFIANQYQSDQAPPV